MKLLDLFCGAGGAAMGYHRAGFDEIVGVDIKPQPRYPFTFVQGDALEYCRQHGHEFDAIHASPPCQEYSTTRTLHTNKHDALVPDTRRELVLSGLPYVIENVIGAPMINPIMLCGTMFGLKVFRHRHFESSIWLRQPEHYRHKGTCDAPRSPARGGGGSRTGGKGGFVTVAGNNFNVEYGRAAMGIDWKTTQHETAQAIPPAYTEYIGKQLIAAILNKRESKAVTA